MEDLTGAYGWAESGDRRLEAISITLVRPDDEWPLQVLAPREQLPGLMTVAEALEAEGDLVDFAWGSVLVQTDSIDGWAALIEPNGWAASMPEALVRLAAFGEAVNVFWNVNAVMSFSLARDGALVRTFDPLLYDDTDGPLPDETELPWGVDLPRASALALVERLTHVRIDAAWLLERPRETFVVPIGN
ncbi:MAG: hypothetical protein QOE66_1588 [Chloroflexota bacterium]|nr:hypothetical protein [Chloroflexota bacterium]